VAEDVEEIRKEKAHQLSFICELFLCFRAKQYADQAYSSVLSACQMFLILSYIIAYYRPTVGKTSVQK